MGLCLPEETPTLWWVLLLPLLPWLPLLLLPLLCLPLPVLLPSLVLPALLPTEPSLALVLPTELLLEMPVSPLPTDFCSTELPELVLLPMLPEASTDMPPTEPLSPDMTPAETPSTDLP